MNRGTVASDGNIAGDENIAPSNRTYKLRFHGAFCPSLAKYSSHRSGLQAVMELPLLLEALSDATNISLAMDRTLHGNAAKVRGGL